MQVNSAPFTPLNQVGIAIRTLDDRSLQNHVGVLYKFNRDEPFLIHLQGHKYLGLKDDPTYQYLWLDLGINFDDIDRAIICAHAKKIADANSFGSIAYGFDCEGSFIDPETGEFKPTTKAIGLTCATFVIELFRSCGFYLLDLDSWQKNQKDDIKWQSKMIKVFLEQPGVSKDVLERQRKNVGNRRYLPEQVACATQLEIPAKKAAVKKPSLELRNKLKEHFKSAKPD